MPDREFKNLIYDKDGGTGIVTVSINRPEIKNALTITVLLELSRAADAVQNDETAKAMIITGVKPADSDDPENEALNKAFSTTDFFEAIGARKEKRAPVFQGK